MTATRVIATVGAGLLFALLVASVLWRRSSSSQRREPVTSAVAGSYAKGGTGTLPNPMRSPPPHPAVSPSRQRVSAILAELDRGEDSSTGKDFRLARDGGLVAAPTRRVELLDELTRLDPQASADYAEKILAEHRSADEWAVALRAYALVRTTPAGQRFLLERFHEMVRYPAWLAKPSAGFLESFDVPVYLGGMDSIPVLTELVRRPNGDAIAHAAFLALDRLVQAQPSAMLEYFLKSPDSLHGREATRAGYFARAQVGDPIQRRIVEQYLLDPKWTQAELRIFAGQFPNAAFMVSPNLLTATRTPSGESLARADRDALKTVEAWLADSRFKDREGILLEIRARLEGFVKTLDR